MAARLSLTHVRASIWRLVPSSQLADRPAAPAQAPEGRFHHSGQVAVYASLSPEGARVAMQRYRCDGISRRLVRLCLDTEHVTDIRGEPAVSVVWQDIRATGAPSPTWEFSDAARAVGAHAMLYSSRSRPELSHIVIFEPSCLNEITQMPGEKL